MRARPRARWLRAAGSGGILLALVSLARADTDAPMDQYNLFNLNSEVIQDQWTQLVWERTVSTTPVSFYDAEVYCATLSLSTGTGASSGWRVPSYKELMTLIDETPHVEYEDGQLITKWIDGDAFPQAAVAQGYWTSSLFPAESGYAYTVDFHSGLPLQQDVTGLNLVRCVH